MGAFVQFLNRCLTSCENDYVDGINKEKEKYRTALELISSELNKAKIESDFMGRWERGKFLKDKINDIDNKARNAVLYGLFKV